MKKETIDRLNRSTLKQISDERYELGNYINDRLRRLEIYVRVIVEDFVKNNPGFTGFAGDARSHPDVPTWIRVGLVWETKEKGKKAFFNKKVKELVAELKAKTGEVFHPNPLFFEPRKNAVVLDCP